MSGICLTFFTINKSKAQSIQLDIDNSLFRNRISNLWKCSFIVRSDRADFIQSFSSVKCFYSSQIEVVLELGLLYAFLGAESEFQLCYFEFIAEKKVRIIIKKY